jgi:hypothetical protein
MTTQGEDTLHMPDRRRRAALRLPLPTAPSSDPRQGAYGPAALPGATPTLGVPVPVPRERRVMPACPSPDGGEKPLPLPRREGMPLTAAIAPATPAVPVLLRERRSPSASPSPDGEDNPFAPPPEGRPDQPWQPRGPRGGNGSGGSGGGGGDEGEGKDDDGREPQPQWGSQWSSRQPGRQSGGFGTGPGDGRRQNGGNGKGGPGGPGGLRWDPTDPVQRRARYALLAGMWGFFFALFSLPEIALLLGALAVYWGVSSLRGKPATARTQAGASSDDVGTTPAPGSRPPAGAGGPAPGPPANGKPQATAAISGLVTGCIALAIVAATFTLQIVYRDYYACVDDALTTASRQSCENLLPEQLRPLLSTQD